MIVYGYLCDDIISIYDIVLSPRCIYNMPNESRVKTKRDRFINDGVIKPIEICKSNNLLTDAYISVLIFAEFGIDRVPVVYSYKEVEIPRNSKVFIDVENLMITIKNGIKNSTDRPELIESEYNTYNGITDYDTQYLYNKQKGKCYLCNRDTTLDKRNLKPGTYLGVSDTIEPLEIGGKNNIDNYAIFCLRCKQLKGSLRLSKELKGIIIKQEEYEKSIGYTPENNNVANNKKFERKN